MNCTNAFFEIPDICLKVIYEIYISLELIYDKLGLIFINKVLTNCFWRIEIYFFLHRKPSKQKGKKKNKIVEEEDDYYDREQNYGGYEERPEPLGRLSDNYEEDDSFGTSYGSRQRIQNFEKVSFNSPPKSASRNRRSIGEDSNFEPSQVSSRSRRSMGEDIHFEPPQPSSRSRRSMGEEQASAPRQLPPLPAEAGGKKKKKKKLLKKLAHQADDEDF